MSGEPQPTVSAGRRRNMQAIRARDTTPELAVRRRIHAAGLRYRVAVRPVSALRRTADIVFTRQRIAVFIDGCFWHSCPTHGHAVGTNEGYWAPKLARTVLRDIETTDALRAAGWTVARFWEHEDADDIGAAIIALVRGPSWPAFTDSATASL